MGVAICEGREEVRAMTKGELRKARKQARAEGRAWNIESSASGGLEIVRERTEAEERKHERAMNRWACRYDELNGAPEGDSDR